MKGDLSHEHEQGDHGETVGGEGVVQVGDHHAEGGLRRNDPGEAGQTHRDHGEGDRHAGEQQHQQSKAAEDADVQRIHDTIISSPG